MYMTHDAMVALVESHPIHWHARIYRNYQHGLDAYVKFAGDRHIYKYLLEMPPIATSAGLSADDPYPSPIQYYLATGKLFQARYTPEEWAAMGQDDVAMTAAGGTMPPDEAIEQDESMAAGGGTSM